MTEKIEDFYNLIDENRRYSLKKTMYYTGKSLYSIKYYIEKGIIKKDEIKKLNNGKKSFKGTALKRIIEFYEK